MSPARRAVAAALACLSLSGAACGKLGPPVRSAPAPAETDPEAAKDRDPGDREESG